MQKLEIPTAVIDGVSTRWPELASTWQETAPEELAHICRRYKGHPVRTFDARYGFVVEIETHHGYLVARSTPDPLGMMQAEISQSLSKLGIGPRVHEVIQTSVSVWTVASRIFPGDSVYGEAVPLERLAHLFQKMRDQDTASDPLPALEDWLRFRLTDESLNDIAPGSTPASPEERRRAVAILEDLKTSSPYSLCHGDASSQNILCGPGEQLFLIDPRGLNGDICYDVAVAAWKTAGDEQPASRAKELARLAEVDDERVQAWLEVAYTARV